MADRSTIEWTDATWNPIGGCTRVDEGCRNCYAEIMAARFSGSGQWGEGLARIVGADGARDHRWTGKLRFNEAALDRPLRWRSPRKIFVNSTSDLFHESVPDEWIDRVFAVMALCPQHTFQVLTKRPDRARAYLSRPDVSVRVGLEALGMTMDHHAAHANSKVGSGIIVKATDINPGALAQWPLPNVWLGTSIHDQASADKRIPELLVCPAAVRFVSAEPLLGPVNLLVTDSRGHDISALRGIGCDPTDPEGPDEYYRTAKLDLVIVGGESGPGARVWQGFEGAARSLRDQCRSAGVAFFMKQMAGARKSSMPPIPDDLMVREMPHAR